MIKPNKDLAKKDRLTLTPRESMKITGIGSNHAYHLLKTGVMPSILVGQKFFIPKAALIRWLENIGNRPTPV